MKQNNSAFRILYGIINFTGMKSNLFFVKVCLWLVCVSLALWSCKKDPEMTVSADELLIESIPVETVSFGISSNVEWSI